MARAPLVWFLVILGLQVFRGERISGDHLSLEEEDASASHLPTGNLSWVLKTDNPVAPVEDPSNAVRESPDVAQAQVELRAKKRVRASSRARWDIFGETGPKFTDIEQGNLGDCYYLAGLASIARTHPNVIEDAISEQEETSKKGLKVYVLRLLVDGFETEVALDERVPVEEEKWGRTPGTFHFAGTTDSDAAWPILMEKAFAKVFGSYLAIVGGWGYDTLKAITQAPVDVHETEYDYHTDKEEWPDPDFLWNTLEWALGENFPMTAGSANGQKNSFGTASGHEFAIIGARETKKHGRVVEIYNPWASNRYNGSLYDENHDSKLRGDYNLTFDEFTEAFDMVTVAHVREDYVLSSFRIPVNEPVALQFYMASDEPFAVQLEWPTQRFIKVLGCRLDKRYVKLWVERRGEDGIWDSGSSSFFHASNLRVDMSGSGRYRVYAFGSFVNAPWVEEVVINVYARDLVEFRKLDNALAVGREILGYPCVDLVKKKFLWVKDDYEALPYPLAGGPAWKLAGKNTVIWATDHGTLRMSSASNGLDKYLSSFDPADLRCKTSSESQPSQNDVPEHDEEEDVVQEGCGYTVGERVSYLHTDHEDETHWICGEIDRVYSASVKVRYLRVGLKTVDCDSEKIKKVKHHCKWYEEDRVQYRGGRGGKKWVDSNIVEVGCGEVKLSTGQLVPCGKNQLRYQNRCQFYKGEKVLFWSTKKRKWHFVKVSKVLGDKRVEVFFGRKTIRVSCSSTHRIKKLSRCDKAAHEQLKRLSRLNNLREIMEDGRDSEFPPAIHSIGPMGADCGDAAAGRPPEDCAMFDTWGSISDVLP